MDPQIRDVFLTALGYIDSSRAQADTDSFHDLQKQVICIWYASLSPQLSITSYCLVWFHRCPEVDRFRRRLL